MNITYNNITIPFYNIKELISNSPYKEDAERNVLLDENNLPKTVVISLSGGSDSASALYLTAKHFPQIEVYPLTFRDVHAPADAKAADDIVKFIQNEFPNANLNDITTYTYDDRDESLYPRAQKLIESEEEYKNLNAKQMSKTMQLDDGNNKFMSKFDRPLRLDGMTSNPPKEIRMSFAQEMIKQHPTIEFSDFELKRVTGETRRDNYNDRPELLYNVYQPFIKVDKKFVADIYQQNNLMTTLYPITRSCVGNAKETNNFTEWCQRCFWCYEKKWAFDLEW